MILQNSSFFISLINLNQQMVKLIKDSSIRLIKNKNMNIIKIYSYFGYLSNKKIKLKSMINISLNLFSYTILKCILKYMLLLIIMYLFI